MARSTLPKRKINRTVTRRVANAAIRAFKKDAKIEEKLLKTVEEYIRSIRGKIITPYNIVIGSAAVTIKMVLPQIIKENNKLIRKWTRRKR